MLSPPSTQTIKQNLAPLLEKYEETHPLSHQAFKKAQQVLPAGSTRSVLVSEPFPLVIKSAEGATLTTVDGITLEDFASDFSAGLYGHSHPVIKDAVKEALDTGFSLGGITEKEAQLASILTKRFRSMDKVRFCNSGTEANTFALAAALAHTKRKKILVFENGYHGGTLSFGMKDNPMNLPHDFVIGKYNDIEATKPLIQDLAAILVEPLQAAGGMHPGKHDFLAFLRRVATETGAVLIFDEVVTSRLHYGGLQGRLGITPDMTTVGKYIGGGFPFGAFGGSAAIMDRFDSKDKSIALTHSGTFNNNIFTMTAAVAAAELITEEKLTELNKRGDMFLEDVNRSLYDAGIDYMKFTGYGSAIGVHFSGPDSDELMNWFYFFMIERGIMIGRRGFMSLNLMHTQDSMNRLRQNVYAFLDLLSQ